MLIRGEGRGTTTLISKDSGWLMGGRAVFSGYPFWRFDLGIFSFSPIMKATGAVSAFETFYFVVGSRLGNEATPGLASAMPHVTPRSFLWSYECINTNTSINNTE